jgi:hypothetical protein
MRKLSSGGKLKEATLIRREREQGNSHQEGNRKRQLSSGGKGNQGQTKNNKGRDAQFRAAYERWPQTD